MLSISINKLLVIVDKQNGSWLKCLPAATLLPGAFLSLPRKLRQRETMLLGAIVLDSGDNLVYYLYADGNGKKHSAEISAHISGPVAHP